MNTKTAIWIGLSLGSTIGGLIPNLWGAGFFSFSGVIFAALGSVLGIWVGYKVGSGW